MQQTLAEKVYVRNCFAAIPASALEVCFHLHPAEGLLPFCGTKRDSGRMVGKSELIDLLKGSSAGNFRFAR
jgi:hypothetical protein